MGPVWSVGGSEDSRATLWSLACVAGITHLPSIDMGRSAGEVFVLLTKLKKKLFVCGGKRWQWRSGWNQGFSLTSLA